VTLGIGRWSRWIAVAGGFGYVPVAPGTAGSAAGALLFLAAVAVFRGTGSGASDASDASDAHSTLSPLTFLALYGLAVLGLLLLGIRAAGRAEVDFGRRDDGRIVIDEVVGQLIALAPLAVFFRPEGGRGGFFELSIAVVTGFVLFRLFDVWKPGAIGWAERRFKGGLGVMADDVVAGVHGAVCLTVLHWLVFASFPSLSTAGPEAVALARLGIGALT
jgi:phosphatidylglycerophosphatase A